jgi:hypothetical protein
MATMQLQRLPSMQNTRTAYAASGPASQTTCNCKDAFATLATLAMLRQGTPHNALPPLAHANSCWPIDYCCLQGAPHLLHVLPLVQVGAQDALHDALVGHPVNQHLQCQDNTTQHSTE